MSRDSFFVPGAECSRGRVCLRGAVSVAESACGQGLRTGAHLRCFPSHRCAAGPSPFTKPRAATPSEVPAHPAFPGRGTMLQPLAGGISPGINLGDASIRKSGPEIRNRCTVCLRFNFFAASIRKSGLEIENRCTDCTFLTSLLHRFASLSLKSGITARITPVLTFVLHRLPSLGLKSGIAARKSPECAPCLQ